jgi:hypothetical protein
MDFHSECEPEEDGRWIGEVPELPGVLAYGCSSSHRLDYQAPRRVSSHLAARKLARLNVCVSRQ